MNVLLADDDPGIMELFTMYLEMSGCVVVGASDGREAIRHLETSAVDLVITDYEMPHANGLEVLAHARKHQPAAELMISSGIMDEKLGASAREIGATVALTKAEMQRRLAEQAGIPALV